MTFLAGIATAAAVASSYDWGDPRPVHGLSGMARGGGGLIIIAGGLCALFFAVLIYAVARGLFSHPRAGAIVFFVGAGILGAAGVLILAASGLVFGDAGNAAARSASSSLSDAEFAGLGALLGAVLAAVAGGLTAAALAQARRRDVAGSAERRPAG